ncbi:Intermediate cleaving peptidase 55 [Smittium mucronatum]|uniref:Intermediate cleaving peptidase 55 n=1 Tax=Smittium mucronatum TaxID=133383 RepID=A0A1R0GUS4_9FUNG|nr:Intermediate cleaving peptidase 55 [Smittium mucronatum]
MQVQKSKDTITSLWTGQPVSSTHSQLLENNEKKTKFSPKGYKTTIFCEQKDHSREVWSGPVNGIEMAVNTFGADEAFPIRNFESSITGSIKNAIANGGNIYSNVELVTKNRAAYISGPYNSETTFNNCLKQLMHSGTSSSYWNIGTQIQKLRLIKSKAEQKLIKHASSVTGFGYNAIFEKCKPGVNQDMLAAAFEYYSKVGAGNKSPLVRSGYVPVFGSGDYALIMHYTQNNLPVQQNQLLLIDAGMEYAEYMSDVSRTIPVSGRYSQSQADLYSTLLQVQEECIKYMYSDSDMSLNDVHMVSESLLMKGLSKLGFSGLSSKELRNILYPHHLSHYLGLNLHDTGDISRSIKLQKGMVVTVEPGVYVPYDDNFPKSFQGMGMRIEDNVIVGDTSDSIQVTTENIPKSISAIEAAMA